MSLGRRRLLHLAGSAAALAAAPRIAHAQGYPTRPVRVIVPFTPGGAVDIIARIIAQRLSDDLGQQFYVENIPTGASNVATSIAAKAPADGYTVLFVTSSFVINPSYYARVSYDAIRDFAPVSLVATSPHVLSVNLSVPANTAQELIALVKANPGKYSYSSAGTGQSAQLAAELFKLAYGLDIVHVPFNGGVPAMTAVIAGHTQIGFNALPSAAAFIKEGKVKALAMTSRRRDPEFPDVPTFTEAGIPNQESAFFAGILVAAGTPPEVVALLNREVVRIVAEPEVRERMEGIGYTAETNSPEAFATMIRSELTQWAAVIRNSKVQRVE